MGLIASAYSAQAACQVTHGSVAEVFANGNTSHAEADCASAATVTSQGAAITGLQASDAAQNVTLTAHGAAIASHAATLANHETRITSTEAVNAAQQTTINTHTGQIAAVQDKNTEQDGRLDGHDTAIGTLEDTSAVHSAMLSDHAVQLGKIHGTLSEHAKGIAIATAMPDAWLSDKESFAIAGGIGGFGDETALGFIAIGRIDQTWSLNAGLGADTEFKEFGWKAGVRAGW